MLLLGGSKCGYKVYNWSGDIVEGLGGFQINLSVLSGSRRNRELEQGIPHSGRCASSHAL